MRQRWLLIVISIPVLLSSTFTSFVVFEIVSNPPNLPNYLPPILFASPLFIVIPPFIACWSGVFWIFQSQNLATSIRRTAITFLLPLLWLVAGYVFFSLLVVM